MADKITQQITDALTQAAASPGGLPLYAGKADPGLFPATSSGKIAAQKCLGEGLVRVVKTDDRARSPRDLYGLTETGWTYLLAQVNPKQVLEDFVRVLETRSGEVGELLCLARKMADNLQGLKEAVAQVLPAVMVGRISRLEPRQEVSTLVDVAAVAEDGSAPFVRPEIAAALVSDLSSQSSLVDDIVQRLRDWAGAAGEDCPLPRLFQMLAGRDPRPTLGEFHDRLRQLHAEGSIYLHPWTGPLYALPEPACALLAGHNVAYYASLRQGARGKGQE